MIKVILVDDEPRLRQAWERLFATQTDLRLVAALPHADDLEHAVNAMAPDVVVLDLSTPGRHPLEAIRQLAASHPAVRALVYSGRSDAEAIQETFDAGAWGYMDKLTEPAAVFSTIRRVAAGEVVFPSPLSTRRPE